MVHPVRLGIQIIDALVTEDGQDCQQQHDNEKYNIRKNNSPQLHIGKEFSKDGNAAVENMIKKSLEIIDGI